MVLWIPACAGMTKYCGNDLIFSGVRARKPGGPIAYFKAMADEKGIPYQSLINLYLRDCAVSERKLNLSWTDSK